MHWDNGQRGVLTQGGNAPNLLKSIRQDLIQIVPSLKAAAPWEYITRGHGALKGSAGVFVYNDFGEFASGLDKLVRFLNSVIPVSNGWEEGVDELLRFGPTAGFQPEPPHA
jgi:chemotaxis protein histidine kinase CheA